MRAAVFVDGENLRFSINKIFANNEHNYRQTDYLPKKADWDKLFDYVVAEVAKIFSSECERVRTYWYVVDQVRPWYVPRNDIQFQSWREQNEKRLSQFANLSRLSDKELMDELQLRADKIMRRFDGFKKIQNDIAQKHVAIEFRRSGTISYNLLEKKLGKEKTVDVNLSVDMVLMRDFYDLFIIVSGDQDYLPAVSAVKNVGRRVVNVAFARKGGQPLPDGSKKLSEITDSHLLLHYDMLAGFLDIKQSAKLADVAAAKQ